MTTVGWICNLDADLELADPDGFAPSARLRQQVDAMAERLLATARAACPRVQHVRIDDGGAPTVCQAWCATPRARAQATRHGVALPAAPALAVLQRVNHRSFAAGFGLGLPHAAFVTSLPQLEAMLTASHPARVWLCKRPFGFSGRGHKRVGGVLAGGDRRWAEASMTAYGRGLMVEPLVAVEAEFALHAWLDADGTCLTGRPTTLVTDERGAWLRSEAATDLVEQERQQLDAAHALAAAELSAAGYFGPFSIDAFRYRDERGELRFHALSELNARYSMGFFVGLAERLEEWLLRVRR
ncbi:MAG: hypothetical protein ACE37K_06085 [Planctomycetota bacterium]